MSLIIYIAMNLLSPGVKLIGINSAGERTDSHTSCCTKLVKMVVMRMSMQLHLAIERRKTLQWQHYTQLAVTEKDNQGKTSGHHLILDDRDPLLKMLMEITATQDGMLRRSFALSQTSSSAQLF